MKKPILCSALFFMACHTLFAQKKTESHWGKKYLDVAYSAAATNDDGYIITGLTRNGIDDEKGDIVVIKTSAKGDTLWTFTYGGTELEGGNCVIQTEDGGYMVSGHTEDFGARDCDAFLMKLDKNGNHEWFKIFGGDNDDICNGTLQLPDGGYVFAGITASYGNAAGNTTSRHVYFVRTNSSGDLKWAKYYAGSVAEYAYSIAAMPEGGFLAVGWSLSYGNGEHDGWLLRLNDEGDTLWTRRYKNTWDTKYYKIIPTQDNGYVVAGYTTTGKTDKPQGLMIKLDAGGEELWEKTYSGAAFRDVAQLPNGNFIFAGASYTADSTGNVYTLTTDAGGSVITDDVCTGSSSYATCIAVQGNNGYLVAGTNTKYGDDKGDLYYVEVDNTTSGIPGVDVASARIFPNPVKGKSSIVLPGTEAYQPASIDVTGIDGKLIYRKENIMAKDLVISRDNLPVGTYLFRVSCKDGKVYKGKFIVN